jgi:arylsulfatase
VIKSQIRILMALVALSLPIIGSAQSSEEPPERPEKSDVPNVVVMMVDNHGWGELGVYGGGVLRGAPTPRLDELAQEGMQLLNFNVEPQCTPSRSAFMTGRHPIRSGTTKVVWGVLYGMTSWEITVAELFSEAGYATGMFGKWHLGDIEGRYPTDQGFDEWYGVLNTTDESEYTSQFGYDPDVVQPPQIQQATRGGEPENVKPYDVPARREIDGEIVGKAIDHMQRQVERGEPFFTFISFTQPHIPTVPHPDFAGITGNGDYADVSAEIDYRSGQILDAIDRLGIRENTLVIWMSDNGPEVVYPHHGTAGYWRGFYFSAMEGSLRAPFLIRWPEVIPAGQKSNEIVHMTDLLPTLARVAGYDVPDDRIIDGVDQLDFLLGKQEKSNREGFPAYNGDELFAYKWRNWKVHLVEQEDPQDPPLRLNVPQVYNLTTDPKELYDLLPRGFSASWVLPAVFERIVEFQKTLIQEPPIPMGTPDPYEPAGRSGRQPD